MANQVELSKILTKDFLTQRYVVDDLFAADIAKEVGCSVSTITTYLRKHGIPVVKKYKKREPNRISKGVVLLTKDFLHQEHVENRRTIQDIARITDTTPYLVRKRLIETGVGVLNNRVYTSTTFTNGIRVVRGYIEVYMPNHPKCTAKGYVRLHRLLMEHHLGRYLEDNEVVHHKNKDTLDNRITNLTVMSNSAHTTYHNLQGDKYSKNS